MEYWVDVHCGGIFVQFSPGCGRNLQGQFGDISLGEDGRGDDIVVGSCE